MTDEKPDGATRPAWHRWRWALAAVGLVLYTVSNWERLTSGKPFVILTAVGVIAFMVSLLWRIPGSPPREQRTDPEAWRTHARAGLLFFGAWFVVACLWLGTAAVLYAVRPANLVVPAIPGSLALISLLTYLDAGAKRAARLHERAEARMS